MSSHAPSQSRAFGVLGAVIIACAALSGPAAAASPGAPKVAEELREALNVVPDGAHGAQLYATICAACHNQRGSGLKVAWAPDLAGQYSRVVIKELVDFRLGVRWYDPMERIAGQHILKTPQDIADVATYIGAMAPMGQSEFGNGQWVERGRAVYAAQCRSCHGSQGEGSNALMIPRIGAQDYEYLLWQMHDAVEGRRPNMKREHLQRLKGFVMEDFVGIADYLSRLRPVEAEATLAPGGAP